MCVLGQCCRVCTARGVCARTVLSCVQHMVCVCVLGQCCRVYSTWCVCTVCGDRHVCTTPFFVHVHSFVTMYRTREDACQMHDCIDICCLSQFM